MKIKKREVIIIAIVICFFIAMVWLLLKDKDDMSLGKSSLRTYTVAKGDLVISVTEPGDIKAGNDTLVWDKDGQLTTGITAEFVYNFDGKLKRADLTDNNDYIELKYDPMGNRVHKSSTVDSTTISRKYIVDISSKLPTILCEIDDSNNCLKNSYIYANSQVLCQLDHNDIDCSNIDNQFFYLHDRLGSVRQVVDFVDTNNTPVVVNSYSYNPFGADFATECIEMVYNPFKYTGQWYDDEIAQYYLRARMYDPQLMRFTGRDPVRGKQQNPLTLHKYLYCLNDPLNNTDINGKYALQIANGLKAMTSVYAAGLGIATVGADLASSGFNIGWDLMNLGAFIQQMSPVAFAIGYSSTPNIVSVTRWGGGFRTGSYGIQGKATLWNYLKTGKWLPHQFAPFNDSTTAYYLADSLYMPTGALSYIDILFGFVKVPF